MGFCHSCIKDDEDSLNDKIIKQPLLRNREYIKDSDINPNNNDNNQQKRKSIFNNNSSSVNPIDAILKLKLEVQANEKLKNAITELPISSDLPRMIGYISVFDNNGNKLFGPTINNNSSQSIQMKIKTLILLLSEQLNIDTVKNEVNNRFHEYIPLTFEGDMTSSLKEMLRALIGDKNPVSNVLKCINQAIIAPAVMQLKIKLLNSINYKDGRNKWEVDIYLNDKVKIVHKKSEISIPNEFEFEWNLTIIFDYHTRIIEKVGFEVVNIIFNEEPTKERRLFIEKKLSMLF